MPRSAPLKRNTFKIDTSQLQCFRADKNLSRLRNTTRIKAIAKTKSKISISDITASRNLAALNVLERQLIAKILPFAKIVALPKGQQRAVHGAVVCVPSDVEATNKHHGSGALLEA